MTVHRAGYLPNGSWVVERSADGTHPVVVATLPTASAARAFIRSVEGDISPLRQAPDDDHDRRLAERDKTLSLG